MKNLKRALSLVLSAAMMVGMMAVGTAAADFTDAKGHANEEAVELMAMIGVMEGDGENFNPDNVVTRNEMAVVMCNLLDLKLNGAHPFTDVADWADKYVAAIYTNGYTAGKGATTYGGTDKITTAEAALMIMKTLGYFEFQGEFGEDWLLATVKRATELELFDDIDASVNEGITRGEVAQMVMNALSVEVRIAYEQGGMTVSGNGITVTEKPEYTYGHTYETLAQKLYDGTLTMNEKYNANADASTAEDAFGRPATTWTYTGGEKASESVTVAKTPAIVFTSAQDDDDITKALKDYTYTSKVAVVDGVDNLSATSKSNLDTLTGNGVRVELFANKQSVITDVVVVNEYIGKVLVVNDAKEDKGIERSVDIVGVSEVFSGSFETEDFAKKDYVKYTKANGEIKSMVAAETVDGNVSAEAATYIKIDGITYKPNALYASSLAGDINLSDDVIIFVDSYGYILELKEKVAAIADVEDYVVVTNGATDDWTDEMIKVLYSDGTTGVLTLDPADTNGFFSGATFQSTKVGMYTYEKTDDGYKFTNVETYDDEIVADADSKIAGYDAYTTTDSYDKDDALLGGLRIADDAVVFVNHSSTKYKVITGAELKKVNESNFLTVEHAWGNKAASGYNYIELAYVTLTAVAGTDDTAYGYVVDVVEDVKNADDESVKAVTFWNGTENVTVLTSNASADTTAAAGLAKGEFFSYELNADGEMTTISELTWARSVSAFDGSKIELSNKAGTTKNVYDVDDDTVIIYVNVEDKAGVAAGEIVIADKNAAETQYIHNVVAVVDGDNDVNVLFVDVKNDIQNVLQ